MKSILLSAALLLSAGAAVACPMSSGQSAAVDRDTVVASITTDRMTPVPAEEEAAPIEDETATDAE